MKTILSSTITVAGLLMTAAAAQSGAPRALRHGGHGSGGDTSVTGQRNALVYVVTNGPDFGVVDLRSGAFLPIGADLPPDVGEGLVAGPGSALLTLTFSGNLDAIDPRTGTATVIGATGLADCSTPASPCGARSANVLGQFNGTLYATDFANNLYSVDPTTAKATLIGHTGIPGLPFIPGPNPDGTFNVYDESLFSAGGKLYANFAAAVLTATGQPILAIPPAIYQIDPKTAQAKWVAPTDLGLLGIVNLDDQIYAFSASSGQVVKVDLKNGRTTAVSDLDAAAGLIGGAAPAHPDASEDGNARGNEGK